MLFLEEKRGIVHVILHESAVFVCKTDKNST